MTHPSRRPHGLARHLWHAAVQTARMLLVIVFVAGVTSVLSAASASANSVATPTLTSFSLQNATLNQGDTVAIDYAATDVGAALHQVLFTYTDACGQRLDVAVTS